MRKIILYSDNKLDKLNLNWSAFHFAFNPDYSSVLARYKNGQYRLIEIVEEESIFVPIIIKNSKLIKSIIFLHPPVNTKGHELSHDKEKQILEVLVKYIERNKIAERIGQPINWCLFKAVPNNAVSTPFGTYCLDLQCTEKELWKGLHPKHRNVIRNAEKKGATIETGIDQVDVFYKLYIATMHRSNMHCEPIEFFKELMEKDTITIYCGVVYNGDEAQGGVFVPYTQYGAYYVYGASSERIELTGAINFLHYKMILELKKIGVAQYDLVGARLSDVSGTKLAGIQRFKQRLGGQLREGILWKKDFDRTKCAMFDQALRVKLVLSGNTIRKDIIDQERDKLVN